MKTLRRSSNRRTRSRWADQTGGDGEEDLAQGEATDARYRDDPLFEVGSTTIGKRLQMRTRGIYALAMGCVTAADDLIDQGAVGAEIVEVFGAPHQKCIADRVLEIAVRTFDRTVLVRDALVIAGWRHPVMSAQFLVAMRQIDLGIGIEVAEGGRKAVAAVIERRAANGPQGVLKAFRQSDEAFAARDDMRVLKTRPDQPEVIEQMVERLTGDLHAKAAHVGRMSR